MKSQKQSVLDAIVVVKGQLTKELSKTEFSEVSELVATSIMDGTTTFSDEAKAKYDTPDKILSYTRGMVNNWLRKSPELNNGATYQPSYKKGPQGDGELKELKKLLTLYPDNEEVKQAIIEKEAKLAEKKKPEIDVDLIPEHLRHLIK